MAVAPQHSVILIRRHFHRMILFVSSDGIVSRIETENSTLHKRHRLHAVCELSVVRSVAPSAVPKRISICVRRFTPTRRSFSQFRLSGHVTNQEEGF
jgi:hypothetical protein